MIQNELTARYVQICIPLKIPTYPTHPDNYSLEIKFIIFDLSKFTIFLHPVLLEDAKGIHK